MVCEEYNLYINTVATDVLVPQDQAICIHDADQVFTVLDQFHIKILLLQLLS